ncbi:MAG: flavodoxin-dependent (E)-4-hydroxy-3-methylbut-2-enyl-diphosphate synthase, partial [Cetobacterium sp.]|nr:flavodoxin-dependent (E)-4-hydroxy-3-methylbut-2-enyl-diphosphate synthase [Cetobacterium sp.]
MRITREVKVGNLVIGGNNKIVIQSMTNTPTWDVEKTVKQIKELESAGCEMVTVTVNTIEAAEAIGKIKKEIKVTL